MSLASFCVHTIHAYRGVARTLASVGILALGGGGGGGIRKLLHARLYIVLNKVLYLTRRWTVQQ